MDDKTRGVGNDPDDVIGRGDETTRDFDAVAPEFPRVEQPRTAAPRKRATSSRPAVPSAEGLDRETDRKTRQIQHEIADTREEMAETIDAIQDRLRPANLVADAKEKVKTATTEKVRHMTETASETAEGMLRQTRDTASNIVEGARQNPIPAIMIGVGVAWLLMDRSGRQAHRSPRARMSDWRTEAHRQRTYAPSTEYYRSQQVAAGTAVDLDEWNEEGTSAREMTDQARQRLRTTTRAAQNGFQRLMRDNPLLVGAAAIVAGAAVGAALPETERENELLGETRDSVVDRAQQVAREAAGTVREVTGDAVQQVTDRLSPDTRKR